MKKLKKYEIEFLNNILIANGYCNDERVRPMVRNCHVTLDAACTEKICPIKRAIGFKTCTKTTAFRVATELLDKNNQLKNIELIKVYE